LISRHKVVVIRRHQKRIDQGCSVGSPCGQLLL